MKAADLPPNSVMAFGDGRRIIKVADAGHAAWRGPRRTDWRTDADIDAMFAEGTLALVGAPDGS